MSGSPTFAVAGDSESSDGVRFSTEIVKGPDVPPPGAGLDTTSESVAADVNCAAVAHATNCVAFAEVTAKGIPASVTVEAEVNPDPTIVSSVAAEPTGIDPGDTEVIASGAVTATVAEPDFVVS